MTDWKSPTELVIDSDIFSKLIHALLGVYVWEYFVSIGFDWDFVTANKRFRWPMIFYFANRYLLLFALIGIVVALDITKEVNCQALYTFNQLAGNAAVGLASINLCMRTMAVYANSPYITIPLSLLILGHWSLILQGVLLRAEWSQGAKTCVIISTNNTVLAATFIYSMIFDFIVLSLNVYKLLLGNKNSMSTPMGSSRIGKLLFTDGLIYFIIAFLSNLLATVFMVINLNAIMSIIFNVPAAVFSTIVACRAVRRLNKFTSQGPEVFHASATTSNVHFRSATTISVSTKRHTRNVSLTQPAPLGVHVQMETFTQTDELNEQKSNYNSDVELGIAQEQDNAISFRG